MAAPPLPHWTVISVPAVCVQLRDTFLPSTAILGTNRLTPATASTERVKKKRKDLSKSCKMQNYLERISKGTTTVGMGALEYERAHFKGWTDRTMEGSFMFLLRIICCNQSK